MRGNNLKARSACALPSFRRSQALRDWYATPSGKALLDTVRARIEPTLNTQFGYFTVQLGLIDSSDRLCAHSRSKQNVVIDPSWQAGVDISAEYNSLPIESSSVDLVILPHALEFTDAPHEVLREVERILIPEGRILVVSFNPYSLWGLSRLFLRFSGNIPWCGHFFSKARLNDWLTLMGFEIDRQEAVFYRPPCLAQGALQKLAWLEQLGSTLFRPFGAVHITVAEKKTIQMTAVGPNLRFSKVRMGGFEATTRTMKVDCDTHERNKYEEG